MADNDTQATAAPDTASAATGTAAPSTVNDAHAALAFADSSFATPESPTETTPAAAETPPEGESESPASTEATPQTEGENKDRSPMIPRSRFDEVNEAKRKAEEALKQYDWAKEFTPDDIASIRALRENPVEGVMGMLQRLESNPQHSAALRSHAARLLASRRQVAAPQVEPEPQPDMWAPEYDEKGQQIGRIPVYSATQQAKREQWLRKQVEQSFDQKLQPITQALQTFQQRDAEAQALNDVSTVLTEFRADPDFKGHEADVKAVLISDARLGELADRDPKMALEIAWNRVWREKVLPARDKTREAEVEANLRQRAVAGSANPASATPTTPTHTLGDASAALKYAESVLSGS